VSFLGEVTANAFLMILSLLFVLGAYATVHEVLVRFDFIARLRFLRINKALHSLLCGLAVVALVIVTLVEPVTTAAKSAMTWINHQALWLQAILYLVVAYLMMGVPFRLGDFVVGQIKDLKQELVDEVEQAFRFEPSHDEQAQISFSYR
jgi:hypothetical protein